MSRRITPRRTRPRRAPGGLALLLALGGLAGCASEPTATAAPTVSADEAARREPVTGSADAPPFGEPRAKLPPRDTRPDDERD